MYPFIPGCQLKAKDSKTAWPGWAWGIAAWHVFSFFGKLTTTLLVLHAALASFVLSLIGQS